MPNDLSNLCRIGGVAAVCLIAFVLGRHYLVAVMGAAASNRMSC